jgi:hypothetical protein
MATSGIRESTAKEATDRMEFLMDTVLLLLQFCSCHRPVNNLSKGNEEVKGETGNLRVDERIRLHSFACNLTEHVVLFAAQGEVSIGNTRQSVGLLSPESNKMI